MSEIDAAKERLAKLADVDDWVGGYLKEGQFERDYSSLLFALTTAEKERDEADRRAGAAERKADLAEAEWQKRLRWMADIKEARGYSEDVPFDTVWDDVSAKADQLSAALAREKALMEANERWPVGTLVKHGLLGTPGLVEDAEIGYHLRFNDGSTVFVRASVLEAALPAPPVDGGSK